MIRILEGEQKAFILDTMHTTYAFSVLPTGQLEHLYYGRKITISSYEDAMVLAECKGVEPGNCICYDGDCHDYTLEDVRLEMSHLGKGDIREPFIEGIASDGSFTFDFVFSGALISDGKEAFSDMPSSYAREVAGEDGETSCGVQTLTVTLKDKNHGYTLELFYYVFSDSDVIGKSARFTNTGEESMRLTRLLSSQLDVMDGNLTVTNFTGTWIREMNRVDTLVSAGNYTFGSVTGTSSNRANPFFIVSRPGCNETNGECIGMNLIYSGNHYESISVNAFGKTRILSGINPMNFSFVVEAGESFQAPEAVMVYSDQGLEEMTKRMTHFVRDHIIRGEWQYKDRPILINSWEANYFNIDEKKLVALAKKGKQAGMELFVMDDGWFGTRDDDRQSLGDWYVNQKKLPNGLKGLADKIHDLDMMFGIWVEPEMVNVNSDLYREHRDWALEIPGMDHSEGRFQRILDLTNPQVVDYMIETMSKVFSSAPIDYVKWDMNRIFSDYYSSYLPKDRQGEVGHRYVLGLYRMMRTLTEKFPHILFEGCASGGCRFDLGILSYFPQIWGSDDTDAVARVQIQQGYSYGYPMQCVTGHVSACPNHQTLRVTPMQTRFHVAAFTSLGYELNLLDLKAEELDMVAAQVAVYKKYRHLLQNGDFHRMKDGNSVQWLVTSRDGEEAIGMFFLHECLPNLRYENFRLRDLCPEKRYHFYSNPFQHDVRIFGSLINTQTPIHVKQDSVVHNLIAKFVKIDGEQEDVTASGDLLMSSGVHLKPSFVSTGFNENIRVMSDHGSRMYFISAE
ncbi:alpha-galactosidase [Lachnospiraceae bacterium C10]|nr:alpha-galactosidase [Lachnospiraceae bacterium C10]